MIATASSPPLPFLRFGPEHAKTPIVCTVPHAGRFLPAALLRDCAGSRADLDQLADAHADQLVAPLVAEGAVAFVATHGRAWIDLNRAPDEIDPAMAGPAAPARLPPSARVRSGLGLIPTRLGRVELLRRQPTPEEVAARLATVFNPYHAAVAAALAAAVVRHGFAVLIDCHSMPSLRGAGARLVIGDRHGRAATPAVAAAAIATAEATGLRTACNAPYAGAYTLARHGRPHAGVHALQVEVDRALYLDAAQRPRPDAVARLGGIIAQIAWAAAEAARPVLALAAE